MLIRAGAQRNTLVAFAAGATVGFSPADATTYRFGQQSGINPGTADTTYAVLMTRPGTVKRASGLFVVAGTLASAGNITFRVRNNTAVTTEVISTVAGTAVANYFSNTALSLAFAAADGLSIEFTTPTWATNPTATFYTVSIEVEFT